MKFKRSFLIYCFFLFQRRERAKSEWFKLMQQAQPTSNFTQSRTNPRQKNEIFSFLKHHANNANNCTLACLFCSRTQTQGEFSFQWIGHSPGAAVQREFVFGSVSLICNLTSYSSSVPLNTSVSSSIISLSFKISFPLTTLFIVPIGGRKEEKQSENI